ncbi:MerR family transcriptional regulator [Rhizobium leguminosarum]|uniref:MerR family transcriptional regulator n=1 Tax=Rhizobium leguminosarum TaxID=384 RepID=UPI003AF0BC08
MNDKKIQFYRIGDVARLAKVSESTIRLWEKQRLIAPDRSDTGQRQYNDDHVNRAKLISQLRKKQRSQLCGDPRGPRSRRFFARSGHASGCEWCNSGDEGAEAAQRRERTAETDARRAGAGTRFGAGGHFGEWSRACSEAGEVDVLNRTGFAGGHFV